MTPGEVARAFNVDIKTVTRWSRAGKLSSVRTPGGQRRYSEAEVTALLAGVTATADKLPPPAAEGQETCGTRADLGYRCTAVPDHEPLDHAAYGEQYELCHRWPSGGAS